MVDCVQSIVDRTSLTGKITVKLVVWRRSPLEFSVNVPVDPPIMTLKIHKHPTAIVLSYEPENSIIFRICRIP